MKKLFIPFMVLLLTLAVVFANPIIDPVVDQTMTEGEVLTVTITASAPDSGNTAFSFSSFPSIGFGDIIKNSNTQATLVFTPDFTENGLYLISVTAQDGDSSNSISFSLNVQDFNQVPTLDLPTSTVIAQGATDTLDLSVFSNDDDGDDLTYMITNENTAEVDCSISGDDLVMVASASFSGDATCSVQVSDGTDTAEDTLTITVEAPTYTFGVADPITFGEGFQGDSFQRTVTISNAGNSDLTNIVLSENTPDAWNVTLSVTDLGTLAPGEQASVTIGGEIPTTANSGQQTIGQLTLTSSEVVQSVDLIPSVGARLAITDLDITIDDETDQDLIDGDVIDEKAKPREDIEIDIEIDNLYSTSSDIEIQDIEVEITIKDIKNGRDLDDTSREFDLEAGDDESLTFDFVVPEETEEKSYDIIIEVTGKDDLGIRHEIVWTIQMRVDKDTHDVKFRENIVSPNTVQCGGSAQLLFTVVNLGAKDEDEVRVQIESTELGIDENIENIEVEEDPDDNSFRRSINFEVPEDARSGEYTITQRVFFNRNILDDLVRTTLNVECDDQEEAVEDPEEEVEQPVQDPEDTTETEDEEPIVIEDPEDTTETETKSEDTIVYGTTVGDEEETESEYETQEEKGILTFISFSETPSYTVVLVVVNLLIVVIGIFVAFHFLGKKPEPEEETLKFDEE